MIKKLTPKRTRLWRCAVSALVLAPLMTLLPTSAAGIGSGTTPFFVLDFSDASDRLNNAVGSSSATLIDNNGITFREADIKGKAAAYLKRTGIRQNYIEIPLDSFEGDTLTVAGWFRISSSVGAYARMLELWNGSGNHLSVMPYAPNYFNGLHVHTMIDGKLLTGAGGADNMLSLGVNTAASSAVPAAEGLLPVYDAWTHCAFVLSPEGFTYYQNGRAVAFREGDFSADTFCGEGAKLLLGATLFDETADFTGAYSDIRLYGHALGEAELAKEFDLKYSDFLTAVYDFEGNSDDSVRDYEGILRGNATIGRAYDSPSDVLILDGSREGTTNSEASCLIIPPKSVVGHGNLTISFDVCTDSRTPAYSYIFSFAPNASQLLLFGARFAGGFSTLLKYTQKLNALDQHCQIDTVYNKWQKVIITLDGTRACIYVDGVLAAENNDYHYSDSIFWEGKAPLAFGKLDYYNDPPFIGAVDNIRLWATALTEEDVLAESGMIADSAEAVRLEYDALSLEYTGQTPLLQLPANLGNGVRVSWESDNTDIIRNDGTVIFPAETTVVTLTATLRRGDVTQTKSFSLTVAPAGGVVSRAAEGSALADASFAVGSHYAGLMKANLDYMMSLDPERLLYSFRKTAGLDTKGAICYEGWINENGGGAGQFESQYVTALAKASQTCPDYSKGGESVLDRLTYMVNELKKCQDAFAERYPDEAGYLGAIPTDCFDGLAESRGEASNGVKVWVPWYMIHKTFEMEYDIYLYAASPELRRTALEMMSAHASWCCTKVGSFDAAGAANTVNSEYGGMQESLMQIYSVTRDPRHYEAAIFFTNRSFIDNIFNGTDALTNLHANTTIPKFLGCAAAYEATGCEYFKTVCVNAFNMIYSRTYAGGGTSNSECWIDEPGKLGTSWSTCETCVSYNMLKLADYLYRWTGDVFYLDYFERTFVNHILTSMDPETGLKTYYLPNEFGLYKLYHTAEQSFYCCACTGLDSFSKLSYGMYWRTAEDTVTVGMYFPSEYRVNDTLTIVQSEDFLLTQKAVFTVRGNGKLTLKLRIPSWAGESSLTLNGETFTVTGRDGFYEITREWKDGDTLVYGLPFDYRLVPLHSEHDDFALMYGPMLMVADLGPCGENDTSTGQQGTPYTGTVSQSIVLSAPDIVNSASVTVAGGEITLSMTTENQGVLLFRPLWQLFHNRFGTYMTYSTKNGDTLSARDACSAAERVAADALALAAGGVTADNIIALRSSYADAVSAYDSLNDFASARFPESLILRLRGLGEDISDYEISSSGGAGSDSGLIAALIVGAAAVAAAVIGGVIIALKRRKKTD